MLGQRDMVKRAVLHRDALFGHYIWQYLLGAVTCAFFYIIAVSIQVGASPNYDCGTYSSGDYSADCADTVSPQTPSTIPQTSSPSTTQTDIPTSPQIVKDVSEAEPILSLNDSVAYMSRNGISIGMKLTQAIIVIQNGVKHTITLKSISDTFAIVTIASTPTDVRLPLGDTINYDLDINGTADIAIRYVSFDGQIAYINFKQISQSNKASPQLFQRDYSWLIWLSLGLLGCAVMIMTYRLNKRRNI
jgi:hypothetical protein